MRSEMVEMLAKTNVYRRIMKNLKYCCTRDTNQRCDKRNKHFYRFLSNIAILSDIGIILVLAKPLLVWKCEVTDFGESSEITQLIGVIWSRYNWSRHKHRDV
ncbi:uncharacterized protein LOC117227338 isoform X1 [Megalopta genalis]|uniref:uncharacterized protein LOC117227338 isoform X1 n=1 Tax=Megalopta genalis TaxID=115081 RepID=UPI003FD1F9EF